jgi:hypothetical protein
MSIRSVLVSTAFAMLAVVATDAGAQAKKGDGPCAADAKKFCAKCMKSHEAELSPACQAEMKRVEERIEQVREQCKADAEKFCKGIRPGQGRILACLKSHQSELAPACAAEFNRAKK